MYMDINKEKDFCNREYYCVTINMDDFKKFVDAKSSVEKLTVDLLNNYDYVQYLHFDNKYNKNNLSLCCDYNELEACFEGVFSGLMEMYDYDMIDFLDEIDSKINHSEDLSFIGFKKCCLAVIETMNDIQNKVMDVIKEELDKYINMEKE